LDTSEPPQNKRLGPTEKNKERTKKTKTQKKQKKKEYHCCGEGMSG